MGKFFEAIGQNYRSGENSRPGRFRLPASEIANESGVRRLSQTSAASSPRAARRPPSA